MPQEPAASSSAVFSALLSFILSVGAAALAINLYSLLRTGKMGASWRVLIVASVLFALRHAIRFAAVLMPSSTLLDISRIIEVIFTLALAYAFWLQRRVFTEMTHQSFERDKKLQVEETDDTEPVEISTYERYS